LESFVSKAIGTLPFQLVASLVLDGFEDGLKQGNGGETLETMECQADALESVQVFWYAHFKDEVNL
jgi:hypothetical protein